MAPSRSLQRRDLLFFPFFLRGGLFGPLLVWEGHQHIFGPKEANVKDLSTSQVLRRTHVTAEVLTVVYGAPDEDGQKDVTRRGKGCLGLCQTSRCGWLLADMGTGQN